MTHIWDTQYINEEEHAKEPPESFHVFTTYYLNSEPSPTHKQLAELTGYKPSRINQWMFRYKYKKRKHAKQQHEQKQKQEAIQKTNATLIPILAQLNKAITQSNINTIQDTLTRQKELATMKTLDEERIQLHKENADNTRSVKTLSETILNVNNFDEQVKQQAQETSVMNDMLEQLEQTRADENETRIHELEEEYEDEEY